MDSETKPVILCVDDDKVTLRVVERSLELWLSGAGRQ